jgi:hypothetical protein
MKTPQIHRITKTTMFCYVVIIITCTILTSCSMSEDFPLPTNPVEKYALPQSALALSITPNPTGTGQVTQTWILREINKVGMRIDSIRINTYSQAGILSSTQKLAESTIEELWESTYIPPLWSGAGARQAEINGEGGGKIIVTLYGHDDNQYNISAADTLSIL